MGGGWGVEGSNRAEDGTVPVLKGEKKNARYNYRFSVVRSTFETRNVRFRYYYGSAKRTNFQAVLLYDSIRLRIGGGGFRVEIIRATIRQKTTVASSLVTRPKRSSNCAWRGVHRQ